MYQTRNEYAEQSNETGAGDHPAPVMWDRLYLWVGFQPDKDLPGFTLPLSG